MKTIGERIRDLRSAAGMSQAELAEKAGMTQTGIASIESGTVSRPRRLVEIARALGVSPEGLLDEEAAAASKEARLAILGAASTLRKTTKDLGYDSRLALTVVGEVAAGVWRDPEQADDAAPQYLPVLVDPLVPVGGQYAYAVRGSSANLIARDGDFAVCADISIPRGAPSEGDLVVVERRLVAGGPVERTIRRFWLGSDGSGSAHLSFDSDDPRFTEIVSAPWPPNGSSDSAQITAKVEWLFRWPTNS